MSIKNLTNLRIRELHTEKGVIAGVSNTTEVQILIDKINELVDEVNKLKKNISTQEGGSEYEYKTIKEKN